MALLGCGELRGRDRGAREGHAPKAKPATNVHTIDAIARGMLIGEGELVIIWSSMVGAGYHTRLTSSRASAPSAVV